MIQPNHYLQLAQSMRLLYLSHMSCYSLNCIVFLSCPIGCRCLGSGQNYNCMFLYTLLYFASKSRDSSGATTQMTFPDSIKELIQEF